MSYLIVFLGGGMGTMLRLGVNNGAARLVGTAYPWGTLFINVTGSLVMGLVGGYLALRTALPPALRLFLMTGILGGYTTFSAFSLETALLYERGEIVAAAAYAFGSVVVGVAALFVGLAIVRALG